MADGLCVTWSEHMRWWWRGGWRHAWVAVMSGRRAGYVRYDERALVSIAVSAWARHCGVAMALLRQVQGRSVRPLVARVVHTNAASLSLFRQAGWIVVPFGGATTSFIERRYTGRAAR